MNKTYMEIDIKTIVSTIMNINIHFTLHKNIKITSKPSSITIK